MSASLYHKQIVAMARRCNEHPPLEHPDASTYIDNPLCGDNVEIGVELKDDKLAAIGFKVRGCLLCEAGATWVAERLIGLTVDVPANLETDIRALLKRENETVVDIGRNSMCSFRSRRPRVDIVACYCLLRP